MGTPCKPYGDSTLITHRDLQKVCGTCHMASSFLPLSRTTTTAICSSNSLLVITLTQQLAPHSPLLPLLTTTPLPSLFTLKLFMPKINFWLRIALASISELHQSVPAPHPGCSTSHQPQKELTPLLALLLISIRDAFLTTYTLLPSHLLKPLITNTSSFHTLIRSSWNSEDIYCRNRVLATNNISMASAPPQGC